MTMQKIRFYAQKCTLIKLKDYSKLKFLGLNIETIAVYLDFLKTLFRHLVIYMYYLAYSFKQKISSITSIQLRKKKKAVYNLTFACYLSNAIYMRKYYTNTRSKTSVYVT